MATMDTFSRSGTKLQRRGQDAQHQRQDHDQSGRHRNATGFVYLSRSAAVFDVQQFQPSTDAEDLQPVWRSRPTCMMDAAVVASLNDDHVRHSMPFRRAVHPINFMHEITRPEE